MADVVDRVVAGHVLLLQEIGGVALALRKDRHQYVGARHLLAAGRLHVNHGTLDDALEPSGRLGLAGIVADQAGELAVDIFGQVAAQPLDIDVAGAHDGDGVLVVGQRQQQMLERRIFMMPLVGDGERPVERLLETAREGWHQIPISSCIGRSPNLIFFPSRIAKDADVCGQSP